MKMAGFWLAFLGFVGMVGLGYAGRSMPAVPESGLGRANSDGTPWPPPKP
jgi:hypothetical protein